MQQKSLLTTCRRKKNKWHVSAEGKQTQATRLKYTTTERNRTLAESEFNFSSTYTIHNNNNSSKQKNCKQTRAQEFGTLKESKQQERKLPQKYIITKK